MDLTEIGFFFSFFFFFLSEYSEAKERHGFGQFRQVNNYNRQWNYTH